MGNKWSLDDTGYDDGYKDGYNQALEDFFNKSWDENIMFYLNPMDCLKEIKEQLKK